MSPTKKSNVSRKYYKFLSLFGEATSESFGAKVLVCSRHPKNVAATAFRIFDFTFRIGEAAERNKCMTPGAVSDTTFR